MIKRLLDNKWTTVLLILLVVMMSAITIERKSNDGIAHADVPNEPKKVIYFIDTNKHVESELSPANLLNQTKLQEIEGLSFVVTSDWQDVSNSYHDQFIHAIIVHHNAVEQVDSKELHEIFMDRTMIVGIGIPGLELATYMGMPAMFTRFWGPEEGEGYTTSSYFYAYSIRLEGEPEDIAQLEKAGWDTGENSGVVIKNPLSFGGSASTDSLKTEEGFKLLSSQIEHHNLTNTQTK